MNKPYYIIVHHSATNDRVTLDDFDAIKRYHMSYAIDGYIVSKEVFEERKKNNDGYYFKYPWHDIGYHFVIEDVKGIVLRKGRKTHEVGAHAYQKMPSRDKTLVSINRQSIGICVVGNFDNYKMSRTKEDKLIDVINILRVGFDIPLSNVLGHREINGVKKSCPGTNVDMNELRAKIDSSLYDLIV